MQLKIFTLLAFIAIAASVAQATLVNTDVERHIDMTNQLCTMTVKQTVQNTGKSPVSSIEIAHDEGLAEHLSFISAKDASSKKDLKASANSVQINIAAGQSKTVEITLIYTHVQQPYPKEIGQEEAQFMRFFGNAYYTSPYETKNQKTTLKVPGKIESATSVKPSSKSEGRASYGPYKDIAANTNSKIAVHFENNTPFLTARLLQREVEVSHWGNVAFTENVDLEHTGAKLKGSFSRLDFQRIPTSGRSSVKEFTTNLPAAAEDVYYRDLIGNVSTSHMRNEEDAVVLELRPRFPLFGGWKTFYTVGYNMPSYEVLYHEGSHFQLRIRFVNHIYDNMVIDKVVLRVILPEGASDIQVNAPFDIVTKDQEVVSTYLDTTGRPTLVFEKENLVEEHIQTIEINYNFSQMSLIREPALIITFLLAVFSFVIIYNHIDFSIDTASDEAKRRVRIEQAAGKIEELAGHYEVRADFVESLRNAIKDKTDSKEAQNKIKDLAREAELIVNDIEKIDKELANKAKDIAINAQKQIQDIIAKKSGEDHDEKIKEQLEKLRV